MTSKVTYISYTDDVKKQMMELETEALKVTAKELRKIVKNEVPVDEGILKKNIGTWVKKVKKTGEVSLQIGVYDRRRALKKGYVYAYHAHLVEFGTVKTKANPYLKSSVMASIGYIGNIQAAYLGKISKLKNTGFETFEDEDVVEDE